MASKFFQIPISVKSGVRAGLHVCCVSLLGSLNPSRWPSLRVLVQRSLQCVFGVAVAPLWHTLGRSGGRSCEDRGWCCWDCWGYGGGWNRLVDITLSPPGDGGPGGGGGGGVCWTCVRVFVCDSRNGRVSKGLWEIQNPQIAEFGCHDPPPTPISCLNCLSMGWAPFHSTAVSPVAHNHVDTCGSPHRGRLYHQE